MDLSGLLLGDARFPSAAWTFPAHELDGLAHVVVWLDDEPGEGDLHATVVPEPGGGVLGLYAADHDVIDVTIYASLAADQVYARIPDGGDWEETDQATPGTGNPTTLHPLLVINEFLASNDDNIQDETGAYEDWLEIYNPGLAAVDLEGMFLSDDLDETTQWAFPDVSIGPGEFLIVWCDDDPSDGPLHATFKLSANGEEIGLWHSLADGHEIIDSVVFGPQTTDVSLGRADDAGLPWITFTAPTPGLSNETLTPAPDFGVPLVFAAPYPNPANPAVTMAFTLPRDGRVVLDIYDVRGLRVRRLLGQVMSAGDHAVVWRGRDDGGRLVASGNYLARLVHNGEVRQRQVLLLR